MHRKVPAWFGPGVAGKGPAYGGHLASGLPVLYDPATLIAAFGRVAGNRGAATPGVDGLTVADVEEQVGVPGFLDDLRAALKDGSFRPLPVRERKIPKPGGSGKVRKLGIATVTA